MKRKKSRRIEPVVQVLPESSASLEGSVRETLLEFVIRSGIGELQRMLERERGSVCGPRYEHQADREAHRHGHARGELVLGGRRVAVQRPRVRTEDGREVTLPSWQEFSQEDPLTARAVEQMVLGVTTRKYQRSLEELPAVVEDRGTSKSAVSRRFVAATQEQLEAFLLRRLDGLDLLVLMIDGIHVAEHVVLVAVGIDVEGTKHVLSAREGATEHSTPCRELLSELRERGLNLERPMLVVIDGGKALAKAVRDVLGRHVAIQRCQVHKRRNVLDHLPEGLRKKVGARISSAYGCGDVDTARRKLRQLERELAKEHPGAAASLREGLDETLTVLEFELPRALERTLRTTNLIENLMGTARRITRNVKRWRGGSMILRWVAAATQEAQRGFRRVRGHAGLQKLVVALRERARRPRKQQKVYEKEAA
jgi:transposase-like protein